MDVMDILMVLKYESSRPFKFIFNLRTLQGVLQFNVMANIFINAFVDVSKIIFCWQT